MDCTRKFKNFFLSGMAVARLSDLLCLEHDLSVIDRRPYDEREKRTDFPKRPTYRDSICEAIDAALQKKPKSFDELIHFLQEDGYQYKPGKQPALKGPDQKRFIRFRSLGEGYSVGELAAVIAGNAEHRSKFQGKNRTGTGIRQTQNSRRMSFLIDIQEKMREGKGRGYVTWAKNFNLKQRAEAMLFMREHKIESFEELVRRADEASRQADDLLNSVKADEVRLQEIAVLKTHIVNFSKSKPIFDAYKASGYSKKFFEEHRDVLTLRRAAKKAFDEYLAAHPDQKSLPRVKELNAEYAEILSRKKKNYQSYAPTLTLAPLTSKTEKKKQQPTHYLLRKAKGLQRPSTVLAEQLGTFDKTCIIRYLGRVSGGQMRGIDEAVKVQLGYYIPERYSRDGHFHHGKYYDHKEETQNEGTPGGQT